jgi:carbonic anhydrase/acetyltransferase-like protein (isoleucine patch superfamily)
MTALRPYLGRLPTLGERVYVDPAATVIGDVELGDDVSIWPGSILRGDVNFIRIGARSNVQDGTIIHVSHHSPYNQAGYPTLIGEGVTVQRHPQLRIASGNDVERAIGPTEGPALSVDDQPEWWKA